MRVENAAETAFMSCDGRKRSERQLFSEATIPSKVWKRSEIQLLLEIFALLPATVLALLGELMAHIVHTA